MCLGLPDVGVAAAQREAVDDGGLRHPCGAIEHVRGVVLSAGDVVGALFPRPAVGGAAVYGTCPHVGGVVVGVKDCGVGEVVSLGALLAVSERRLRAGETAVERHAVLEDESLRRRFVGFDERSRGVCARLDPNLVARLRGVDGGLEVAARVLP